MPHQPFSQSDNQPYHSDQKLVDAKKPSNARAHTGNGKVKTTLLKMCNDILLIAEWIIKRKFLGAAFLSIFWDINAATHAKVDQFFFSFLQNHDAI